MLVEEFLVIKINDQCCFFLKKFCVIIADDLSSDEGEDKIYTDPPDLFNEDIKNYGAAYAKYKAKILAEENTIHDSKNFIHSTKMKDLDEESIDGYKGDSDDGFYYGQDDYEQYSDKYPDDEYNLD